MTNEQVQVLEFPYYVKALALGIPAILVGLQFSGWVFIFPAIVHGHSDFRQLYTAGYMLRTGYRHSLYDYDAQIAFQNSVVGPEAIALPFNHLAYEALLFVPFSALPYRVAFFAFLLTNLLLLWVSYKLLRPQLGRLASIFKWLPAVMLISFLPVGATLMQGQDSIVLLALIAGMTYCVVRGKDLAAGVLLGLGCFKFQLVVPIAVLFLAGRTRRLPAGFAISAVLTATISLWIVGFSQFTQYSHSLLSMSAKSTALDQFRYGINPIEMPNVRGLVYGLLNSHVSRVWIQVATLLVSFALFLAVSSRLWARESVTGIAGLAIAAATALSYHLYMHDLSVLAVPILLMSNTFATAESSPISTSRWALRVSTLMFIAPALMSFMPFRFYLVCLPLLALIWILALKPQSGLNACRQIN